MNSQLSFRNSCHAQTEYVIRNGKRIALLQAEVDVTKEGNGWHAPSVWTVDVLDVRPVSLAICAETIDVCTMSAASVECLREWCHDWLVDAGGDFVIEELIQGAGL